MRPFMNGGECADGVSHRAAVHVHFAQSCADTITALDNFYSGAHAAGGENKKKSRIDNTDAAIEVSSGADRRAFQHRRQTARRVTA